MTIKVTVRVGELQNFEEGIGTGPSQMFACANTRVHGVGRCNVLLGFSSDQFHEMAEAMMTANPDEATKAFGHALKSGPAAKREHKRLRLTPSDEEILATTKQVMRETQNL